jgi:hypothetical protein
MAKNFFECNGICILNFDRKNYLKPVKGKLYQYQYKDIDEDTIKFYYFQSLENNKNWVFLTNKKFECVYGAQIVDYRNPIDDYDTPLVLLVLSECALLKSQSDKKEENYFIFYRGQLKNVSKNLLIYEDIIPCDLSCVEVKPKKIFEGLEQKMIDLFNEV